MKKKIVIQWKTGKPNDSGEQSKRLVGAHHSGCCKQNKMGCCPKKHGG